MFTFYIDGVEVGQPREFDSYSIEVVRDPKLRFIHGTYTGSFTITGASGYSILRAAFVSNTCDTVFYEAFETCGSTRYPVLSGTIILADCKWNLEKCTVEVDVQDQGVDARIKNNLRIPISPGADKSKNGVDITPVQPLFLQVFDPADPVGTYLPDQRSTWDWMDCLKHAVQYMTDGAIVLESEWYDTLPDDERLAILSGNQLRTADTAELSVRVTYDFNHVWLEFAKRFNLWMCVRYDTSGVTYLSVEPEDTMYSDEVAITAMNQPDLVESIDRDQLYAAVEVGDEDGLQNLDLTESLPYLVLRGFSKEKFHFAGECNVDEVLDLVGDWHADTNTIERVLVTDPTDDGMDKDVFILQYTSYLGSATKGDYLEPNANPYLYNETMQNISIVNRYDLPSDIGQYYAPTSAGFQASFPGLGPANGDLIAAASVGPVDLFPFPAGTEITYPDDFTPPNNDVDDNWSVALQRYTAPAQGFYEFTLNTQIILSYEPFAPPVGQPYSRANGGVRLIVERYDVGNTLIATTTVQHVSGFDLRSIPGPWDIDFVFQSNMNVGDYLTFTHVRATQRPSANPYTPTGPITVIVDAGMNNTIRTSFVATGGGVLTSVDPAEGRVVTYEFERLVPVSQWDALRFDPRRMIPVSTTSVRPHTAHAMKVERDVVGGSTKFTLIAKRKEIQ